MKKAIILNKQAIGTLYCGADEKKALAEVDEDPIVLFKCKFGYLILSSWGDEAEIGKEERN